MAASSVLRAADKKKAASSLSMPARMEDSKRAMHGLNRLTFGPRPGEAERVANIGVDKWIEEQLHPDKIDDSALDARLAPLLTLRMQTKEIVETFPAPQVLKAIAEGRQEMPSDPTKRVIYESALAQYRAQQDRKAERTAVATSAAPAEQSANMEGMEERSSDAQARSINDDSVTAAQRQSRRDARMETELRSQEILNLPPKQRYATLVKMTSEERQALNRSLSAPDRDRLFNQFTPQQRETVMALGNPQQAVANEIQEGKILRAVYSQRQLQEVMTDFWFNHFNVFINKGADRYLVTAYERDVIRPRAFGKFKDLLLATAQSPAMLFYLDNWQSVGPDSGAVLSPAKRGVNGGPRWTMDRYGRMRQRWPNPRNRPVNRQPRPNQQRRGLNENYAREIMELHTLGVGGGFSQKDVTELAKILTGWTIKQPEQGGAFEFNPRMHEPGKKYFLGKTIKEDGENEGKKVIEMLAKNPATAKFICRKLAMRFVSDNPPAALVERMSNTYLKSDGDIREVLRALFRSPDFWATDAYRVKIKTPFEFVASAVRATGAEITNPLPLAQALNRMGMPLYGMQPPTGYSMKADAWVNSAALLNRMNFALGMGLGRMQGIQFDSQSLAGAAPPPDSGAALEFLEGSLLDGEVSQQTHQTILKQLTDPQVTGRKLDDPARPPNLGMIAGLILGSPEFQRR
jgi:uncharacterized protein (DUF1800 family)